MASSPLALYRPFRDSAPIPRRLPSFVVPALVQTRHPHTGACHSSHALLCLLLRRLLAFSLFLGFESWWPLASPCAANAEPVNAAPHGAARKGAAALPRYAAALWLPYRVLCSPYGHSGLCSVVCGRTTPLHWLPGLPDLRFRRLRSVDAWASAS